MAHGGRQGHVVHDLPVIGEGVLIEKPEVIGVAVGVADLVAANHPDVAEREGDALPQLILRGEIDNPVALLQRTKAGFSGQRVGIGGEGRGVLRVQKILKALNLNLIDQGWRGPE